ncbi:hypothetical protein E1293_46930, partial [Actinomadura darangshiensis]
MVTSNASAYRRLFGVLTAAGVLLLSAACGGGGDADTGSGKGAGADPMASFRICLEKQGVKLPERGNAPGGGAPPPG